MAKAPHVTLRAASSAVVFGLVAAGAVVLIGDAVIRGSWDVVARVAGPAAVVVWAAWLLMVRPSIEVLPDRARVINVGRITEVPWSRVVDVRRKLQLVFDLEGSHRLEAWGSPFISKKSTPGKPVADPALATLKSAWMSSEGDAGAVVERRPDTLALAIGGIAVIAAVLSLTLGSAT